MIITALSNMGGAFSPERLALAGQVTLLGMLMVFAVLTLLFIILTLFRVIFAKSEKKPDVPAEAKNTAEEAVSEVIEAPAEADDTELVAILTAAIVSYEAGKGNDVAPNGFRVVSFRRTNGGKSWNSK